MEHDSLRVATGSGLSVTALITSVAFTMPVSQDTVSANPRYIRVLPEASAYINFGTSSAVSCGVGGPSGTPGMLITANESQVFNVRGYNYFAVIAKTATVVNVTPIEA